MNQKIMFYGQLRNVTHCSVRFTPRGWSWQWSSVKIQFTSKLKTLYGVRRSCLGSFNGWHFKKLWTISNWIDHNNVGGNLNGKVDIFRLAFTIKLWTRLTRLYWEEEVKIHYHNSSCLSNRSSIQEYLQMIKYTTD